MNAEDARTKTSDVSTVDTVIEDFLARKLNIAAISSPYYHELWSDIARLFHSGGKRLRPRIALLSYQMFGGNDVTAILPAAASLELIHLGMLIHDDVIDRDYTRYGVDNIAGSYSKKYESLVSDDADRLHYAHSAALLAGDLLLSEAYIVMAESPIEARKIIDIQKLLGVSISEVICGEMLDTEAVFREPGSISAELIAHYKTASYTITLPMLVGAQLADVSEDDQVAIRTFGHNLGVAFQLRDDIIGIFGNEAETGKTVTGDIREGKRTYMTEQFYELATDEQRVTFDELYGKSDISDDQAAAVRRILKESGALEQTEQTISSYEKAARHALETLTIDQQYLAQLNELISVVTKRTK